MLRFLLALWVATWSTVSLADYNAGMRAYENGDFEAAAAEFRELAEKGVVLAQTNLGYMYSLGEGVEQNAEEAAKWFRKAAEGGSSAAQLTMGALAYHGEGVPRSPVEAYAWFSVAASKSPFSHRSRSCFDFYWRFGWRRGLRSR